MGVRPPTNKRKTVEVGTTIATVAALIYYKGLGATIGYLFVLAFVVGFGIMAFRHCASWIGQGRRLCNRGWYLEIDFPLLHSIGVIRNTETFLAVRGVKITQCQDCKSYFPPDGEEVANAFRRGDIDISNGSLFEKPKVVIKKSGTD